MFGSEEKPNFLEREKKRKEKKGKEGEEERGGGREGYYNYWSHEIAGERWRGRVGEGRAILSLPELRDGHVSVE